ncbi:rhodanese-like domain-containing protein [Lysinibacillus yapensis]|uniref:Rhodanese-like domain-containing protein n=1 Tax=Ureibacillus yapensis TaxID=2304605 RepID=A0A396SKU8_9BACL|nr:rhodanese-like domain-containing protein [Lysinibacillus yapensis]RHW35838.1 rhodanese-like domain-containing protein [Lysinibacillus yapensis]
MVEPILIIILAAFLVYRLTPAKGINNISTEELRNVLNDPNKVFIDVRSPIEYKGQHIKQFKNVPLKSNFKDLPKDKEIVVICQTGIRSNQACKKLKRLGHKNITNVSGGLSHWKF